ncbi:hypothetical protein GFB49_09125 [Epibacterium sp. SM1979]|uniref:GP-PDE domain-containing protein n=1 Tax=Tritonibacter litoralis TaxID=2662264 RepID=A0A843YCD2_9RHOB|nr:glycerophosphodiester phosphodiesterase family protein [Tritonibacter litoralis]MQQ08611.1 hypothetical protein [Tritonibacter litoralis]
MNKPLIFGHRGTPATLPENTMAGFTSAIAAGADGIELDVFLTRDGIPVVTHNPRLLPDTTKGPDGQWLDEVGPEIASLSLSELQGFDVGACRPGGPHAEKHLNQQAQGFTPVPTLDDVLSMVAKAPRPVRVLVELKHTPDSEIAPEAFVAAAAEVVSRHDLMAQSAVHAFNWQILRAAAKLAPDWARSHLSCSRASYPDGSLYDGSPWLDGLSHDPDVMLPQLAERGARNWSPFYKDLTPEALALAQSLEMTVMTWTVNGDATIQSELARGVDGIVTDAPATAVALRDKVD